MGNHPIMQKGGFMTVKIYLNEAEETWLDGWIKRTNAGTGNGGVRNWTRSLALATFARMELQSRMEAEAEDAAYAAQIGADADFIPPPT